MNTIRRVWFYVVTIVTLGIFAAGVGQLLNLLFNMTIKSSSLTGAGAFNQQQLSLGLAMTVIGGPLWFFFWRALQRRVKDNREETGATIRKLFLNFILLVTAFMALITARNLITWLLAGVSSASGLAMLIVAGIIWFYHWRVSEDEGQPSSAAKTLRRWYVYILAGFSLVWLAMGLVQLINTEVVNLPVWGNPLVRGQFWNSNAKMSIALILIGGVTWYFHWFRMARNDFDSKLRQVYFYLPAISGGAITVLVALTILLYRIFLSAFGNVSTLGGAQFQFLGWAIPTILAGLAIWGYHLRLAQEEAGKVQEKRQSAQRVYFYLMSFLGLGTMVAGFSILFGLLINLIINAVGTSLTLTTGWWQKQLAVSLALLIVGAPLWLYYWNGILKRVQKGGISEWRALSRRIFLYVIIGVSIITLAADLVNIVYQLLSGVLKADFGVNVLRNAKWSVQTLVVAVPLLWYHWRILRTDQHHGAESIITQKTVTLLIDDRSGDLASRLESKLGIKIHLLYQVGQTAEKLPSPSDEEIERLADEIQSSAVNKIMLVAMGGKVFVLPYQDKQKI